MIAVLANSCCICWLGRVTDEDKESQRSRLSTETDIPADLTMPVMILNFTISPTYTPSRPLAITHSHLLTNPTRPVGVINQSTPLITSLRTLRKRGGQPSSVVRGINLVQPSRVREICIDDVLRVDEEVLGRSRDAGVFVGERGHEHGGDAVVVEFPV